MTTDGQETEPKAASLGVYNLLHNSIRFLVNTLWRYTVTGKENLPASGPYLVVTNHLSVFDAPLVFANVTGRAVMFGADKWRRMPGVRQLLEAVGVIWVTRGEADTDAMKGALRVLKSGRILGVAPEGTRSPTGALIQGKPGAAYLADRARVPLVPMAITGTENISPNWKRLRRPNVYCHIGQPFWLPPDGRAKGPRLDQFTDQIMCTIAAMLPAKYRGVYADHPLLKEMLAARAGDAVPQA